MHAEGHPRRDDAEESEPPQADECDEEQRQLDEEVAHRDTPVHRDDGGIDFPAQVLLESPTRDRVVGDKGSTLADDLDHTA